MAPPAKPITFGRYQLIRKLAAGGMAEVYLADLSTAAGITKQLVIKKILKYYADDAEFREMFIGEARIAVGLSHGNIAQVFDFGEVEGEYFLALEYVAGRSVADLFKRAVAQRVHVPVEYAAFIAMEMCKGLHYAHTRVDAERRPLHLVHRDISPQNVLVSYEGQVKLVDFGIAKAYGKDDGGEKSTNTETGVVKGKYLYFSPEQASAQRLDGLTDVYATGVVLYEMVCGRRPFEGQQYAVLGKLLSGDFPHPRTLRPALPEALAGIVMRAMATKKEDRFGSALEMQESLAGFLAEYAPRLTQASITNLMRWLFRADLESAGEDAEVPASFAAQVRDWGLTERQGNQSGATRPDHALPGSQGRSATVAPGDATVPTPSRPPWLALGLGAGALALVGVGAVVAISHSGGPREMEAVNLVVPMHSTAPTPAPAPPPPPPAPKGPLPDLLAELPLAPGVKFGGKTVAGLRCEDEPKRPEVKDLETKAASAAIDSHFNEATSLLNEAIGGEPTAGALYVTLVDDSAQALEPSHLDVMLRDIETFRAACPSTRRPLIDTAYDRLSGLALPDPTPSPTDAHAEADREAKREAGKLRNDAERLMHRQQYEQALAKLQSAIELTPGDPKLMKLQQACLESSGGEIPGRAPAQIYRAPGPSKGRH